MRLSSLVTTLLLVLAMPAAAHAQRLLHLGVGGGLTLPQGTFGSIYNAGYNARGFIALDVPASPLGLRVGIEYERFGSKRVETLPVGDFSFLGWTADLIYDVGDVPAGMTAPYAIAGAGLYDITNEGGDLYESSQEREFGWHVGLGIRFGVGSLTGFIEGRYRSIALSDAATMFPLTIGLRF